MPVCEKVVSSLVEFFPTDLLCGIPERVQKQMKVCGGDVPVFNLGNGVLCFQNKTGDIDLVHINDCVGASIRQVI